MDSNSILVAARAAGSLGLAELARALFPPLCWLCRTRTTRDDFGCEAHALRIQALDPAEARCLGCACRLPAGLARGLCAVCRREARGYRHLCSFGSYRADGVLREWILAFKHGGRRELAVPLAAVLAEAWRAEGGPPPGALLVPVPLHPLRRLERGYDQARELAAELAGELGLELVGALRRARRTAPQGGPGASSRRANVAGAFALRARSAARLAGREVWLVDDVVTSGATVGECARVLRQARVAEVSVLALARAERAAEDELARGGPPGDDAR
ncbi:MAG: ComF family protein [Planctomycetes bacterium]|nr:ComF family protein [Planctomycetota bacterium]